MHVRPSGLVVRPRDIPRWVSRGYRLRRPPVLPAGYAPFGPARIRVVSPRNRTAVARSAVLLTVRSFSGFL